MSLHDELVRKAAGWLRGQKCYPIICESTSCGEAPDAIGWNSDGSIVVECKTSLSDLQRDVYKYQYAEYDKFGRKHKISRQHWAFSKYKKEYPEMEIKEYPRMGDYRYVLCPAGLFDFDTIEQKSPAHGLLFAVPRGARKIVGAPRRQTVNESAEIKLLRLHYPGNPFAFNRDSKMRPEEFEFSQAAFEFSETNSL